VPISQIGTEYFVFDREAQTLTGADTGRVLAVGDRATVRLAEATPITGGLLFELLEVEGKRVAGGRSKGRKASAPRRKQARARIKQNKTRRKR
ncbi:MAG: ribonuclease R, partial [Pseudomonadota bacterium]